MDGILNVYKEKGYTSHDVVAKLRGILKQKKIGHTGTLDPEAVGVLPVCLGQATKVCGFLADKTKTYVARVRLGVVTDTQDMTGEILKESPVHVTEEELRRVISGFTGEIWQLPPMYSAVKVNGKRLYELARQGLEVERKKRRITIYSCRIIEFLPETHEFSMEVQCSRGTYIRTLCHDIGEQLGCGAAMDFLERTKVGCFECQRAFTVSEIEQMRDEGTLAPVLVPLDTVFQEYPEIVVSQKGLRFLENGNMVRQEWCEAGSLPADGETVRMYGPDRTFYAVYRYDAEKNMFSNVKMFYRMAGQ